VHTLGEVNDGLAHGRYFFMDVAKDEYLNTVYDEFKRASQTGDYSGVLRKTAEFGVGALLSGLFIGGTIIVAGAIAPWLATLAAAAWTAYGIWDALGNLEELFGKIAKDLSASTWLNDIFGSWFSNRDPLVLDMDLGGVSLAALGTSNTYFDLNNDGFAERVGWASPREGLLALDVNRNGRIDNGGELFGTATQNGFEVLARYDDNRDGRIDTADSLWTNLLVWRDADRDGVSDAGELTAITGNDVSGISLAGGEPGLVDRLYGRAGNSVLAVGDYTRQGGNTAEAIAVAFTSDQTNTQFQVPDGFAYDPEVFKLPNLRGYGSLTDLWVAMSLDPELKTMVEDLVAGDYDEIGYANVSYTKQWACTAKNEAANDNTCPNVGAVAA
jgi:hypothetical protein